jgi:quaternary ammonium compound-resistance protein SugE
MSALELKADRRLKTPVGTASHSKPESGPAVCAMSRKGRKGFLMAWVYILLADVFEVAWPFVLKRLVGLPRWTTALSAVVFALPIFLLLSEAVKRLPASTVYASFVGIGTLGTAIVGIVFFGESANLGRLGSFMLVVIGLVGLKLFSE